WTSGRATVMSPKRAACSGCSTINSSRTVGSQARSTPSPISPRSPGCAISLVITRRASSWASASLPTSAGHSTGFSRVRPSRAGLGFPRAVDPAVSARTLMVQGTTSDAGKSTLVAGLCRVLRRRGVRVAPFKPQNMALNSAVGIDGGELGRAQALQAQAAGIPPTVDLNPVLLKPSTDQRCQVIIHGKALGEMGAWDYHEFKRSAREAVLASYHRLRAQYEVIVVEGAGSPAEINLREGDIANMGFAEAVDCPVLLIADIDRGGVLAHLVGTLALLSESERQRVRGFVINRFRGDLSLLQPGLDWLEGHTGRPVLGVLPYLHGLQLDAEDGISREAAAAPARTAETLQVVVPVLPRISNHTDFEPLARHPQVQLHYIGAAAAPPPAD